MKRSLATPVSTAPRIGKAISSLVQVGDIHVVPSEKLHCQNDVRVLLILTETPYVYEQETKNYSVIAVAQSYWQ